MHRLKFSLCVLGLAGLLFPGSASAAKPGDAVSNSLGMKMVPVAPGSFDMGAETQKFDFGETTPETKDTPLWDETPRHTVTITRGFLMSSEEVTVEQFRQFRPDFQTTPFYGPYATGVSWEDAVAFCRWLGAKEGKQYRLPTEAEWEYACRAGTQTLFWSGEKPPKDDVNPWGIRNMHTGPAEWCLDWHGEYSDVASTDPVGPAQGWGRVVRGGPVRTDAGTLTGSGVKLVPDSSLAWRRCSNRCSLMPGTPAYDGQHYIHSVGFRVVEAPLPDSRATPHAPEFPLQGVRQESADWREAPDASKPYFKARVVIPSPPDFSVHVECAAVGFSRAMQGKVHSGGIAYCPNGDLIAISFTSSPGKSESAPSTAMVITRLRRGAEEWDMPEVFYKLSGLNDQSGLLWTEGGKLWFFGGGRDLGMVPFRVTTSTDNGATWSELKATRLVGAVGTYAAQPINSVFRGPDGTLYLGCDGKGSESLLWASRDNGLSWADTGGRTAGRHTTFVMLKDGRILGMGGKDSQIDAFMPRCFSADFGATWSVAEKTPFGNIGSNQRPKILRLASGRLFFAGDFQNIRIFKFPPPASITERGSYVALSDDEGKTWRTKKLALATPHNGWTGVEQRTGKPQHGFGTLGYCDAVQSPDGLIHLMTSKGKPSMHFAMNEAWILSDVDGEAAVQTSPEGATVVAHKEGWPEGGTRSTWNSFKAANGMEVLHGSETWCYRSGAKQYQVNRYNGRKLGRESCWSEDGRVLWEREYGADGSMVWTSFWPNGAKKTESRWVGAWAQGETLNWDPAGKLVRKLVFKDGRNVSPAGPPLLDD